MRSNVGKTQVGKEKVQGVVDSLHQSGAGVDSVDELRKAFST